MFQLSTQQTVLFDISSGFQITSLNNWPSDHLLWLKSGSWLLHEQYRSRILDPEGGQWIQDFRFRIFWLGVGSEIREAWSSFRIIPGSSALSDQRSGMIRSRQTDKSNPCLRISHWQHTVETDANALNYTSPQTRNDLLTMSKTNLRVEIDLKLYATMRVWYQPTISKI